MKKKSDMSVVNVGAAVGGAVKRIARWMSREGAFERPSQDKPAIPATMKVPQSLESQVARLVRSQLTQQSVKQRAKELDPDFEDLDSEARPFSPHELVTDPELGVEVTRWEKESIDKARAAFDARVQNYIKLQKERRATAPKKEKVKSDVKKPVLEKKPD